MFRVGDCISYPMHGAGYIEAIEEREVMGHRGEYYVLFFYSDVIKVMVPIEKADNVGMRAIIALDRAVEVFDTLSMGKEDTDENWNRRNRSNLDKLRMGSAKSVAEVVCSLSLRDKRRGLSAGEKKMLSDARRFLLGELFLAGFGSEEEISRKIDDCLMACC